VIYHDVDHRDKHYSALFADFKGSAYQGDCDSVKPVVGAVHKTLSNFALELAVKT
jgi:hypothetical protein